MKTTVVTTEEPKMTVSLSKGELVRVPIGSASTETTMPRVQECHDRPPGRNGITLSLGVLIVACVGVGAFALGVGLRANSLVASVLAIAVTAGLAAALSRRG